MEKVGTRHGEPAQWVLEHIDYADDGCLTWPYSKDRNGYGRLWVDSRLEYANVVIATIAHGAKPSQAHKVLHSCGKGHEGCCNPRHLRWATNSEIEIGKLGRGTDNRGEKSGKAKLTETDVRGIVEKLNGGWPISGIAEAHEISRRTIYDIGSGKCWSWLTGITPGGA